MSLLILYALRSFNSSLLLPASGTFAHSFQWYSHCCPLTMNASSAIAIALIRFSVLCSFIYSVDSTFRCCDVGGYIPDCVSRSSFLPLLQVDCAFKQSVLHFRCGKVLRTFALSTNHVLVDIQQHATENISTPLIENKNCRLMDTLLTKISPREQR